MRNSAERKICIICEGFEEIDYLNTLINKAVFSSKYEFVLINSKSINNINSVYQIRYQSNSYDLVLVFCDTDKNPYTRYKAIKDEIDELHGKKVVRDIKDNGRHNDGKNEGRKSANPFSEHITIQRRKLFLRGIGSKKISENEDATGELEEPYYR